MRIECPILPALPLTALITGASGGLGEEFARLLAQDGINLVLVARSEEKLKLLSSELEKKHGIQVLVLVKDLSVAGIADEVAEYLEKTFVNIDILINNAGLGAYGLFHQTEFEDERQVLQVNIHALTELTKLLLPGMIERKAGRILNVASTAAFLPGPLMAVYYASKAYVVSFSEAIASELSGTGVTVTCLCPGWTHTGFQLRAKMQLSRMFRGPAMEAKEVALQGYRGMQASKRLVIPGILNKLEVFATRFVPLRFAAYVVWRMQKESSPH